MPPDRSQDLLPLDRGRLRAARLAAGLSQEALARKADLTLTTVARMEQGTHSQARAWSVEALAVALGLEVEDLLTPLEERYARAKPAR